jgi:hypothetical protein
VLKASLSAPPTRVKDRRSTTASTASAKRIKPGTFRGAPKERYGNIPRSLYALSSLRKATI